MGFPENGLCHQSRSREDPMRHTHNTRTEDLRQPAWAQWIADVLGLTDYSGRLPRTALARCLLLAASLGLAVSAVARFSVLAEREREAELGDAVRRLGATGSSRGYRVRLSGPWPPYRFGGLPREHALA